MFLWSCAWAGGFPGDSSVCSRAFLCELLTHRLSYHVNAWLEECRNHAPSPCVEVLRRDVVSLSEGGTLPAGLLAPVLLCSAVEKIENGQWDLVAAMLREDVLWKTHDSASLCMVRGGMLALLKAAGYAPVTRQILKSHACRHELGTYEYFTRRLLRRGVPGVLLSAVIPASGKIIHGHPEEGIPQMAMVVLLGFTAAELYSIGSPLYAVALALGSLYYLGGVYGTFITVRRDWYHEVVRTMDEVAGSCGRVWDIAVGVCGCPR